MRVSSIRYFIGTKSVFTFSLIFLTLFLPQAAFAVPAFEGLFELTQPNGIKFRARNRGDERNNWVETEKGFGIYLNKNTRFWEYYLPSSRKGIGAKPSHPVSGTNAVVGVDDPAALGIPKGLSPAQQEQPSEEPRGPPKPNGLSGSPILAPVSGTKYVLVIAVEYDDQPATYNATSDVQAMAFGGSSSIAHYFSDVSYSSVTIAPPTETSGTANDGVIGWLNLGTTHPNTGGAVNSSNQQISKDAIEAADAYIDFSAYDSDNNGTLDASELSIIVMVAGYENAYSNTYPAVWAHKWDMSTVGYPVVDSVTIEEYAQVGEIHLGHFAEFGVVAHEVGHLLLGLPDLYDTDFSNGASYGIGAFGLMGGGSWGADFGLDAGSSPVHPTAWSKQYLDWGTVTILSGTQTVNFPKVDGNSASIFRINTSDANQYFLVENRLNTGYDIGFKRYGGSWYFGGLAIYHIDETVISACLASNCVNDDENNKGIDVEEADEGSLGFSALDSYIWIFGASMLYRSTTNTGFGDATTPNSKLNDGSSTDILIGNISNHGDIMTAYFGSDTTSPSIPASIFPIGSISTSTTVTFIWSAATDLESGVAGYNFQVGTTPGGNDITDTYLVNTTVQNATGSNGQTLYARVQAINGVGLTSSWSSNSSGILIDITAPSTPSAPASVGVGGASTTVTFNWVAATDGESGVASYNLQVGTTAGGNDVFNANVGNVLTYNITGSSGQTLYGRLQAIDNAGLLGSWSGNSSGISLPHAVTDTTSPSTPASITDSGTYSISTTVTFNWTAATDAESGIASYNLQVGTIAGGSDVFNANVGNVLTYNVTGSSGQTLYARIQAVNGAGLSSSYSGNSDGITIDISAPSTPASITDSGTYSTSTTVTFTWGAATDPESGIASYNLQVGTTAGGNDLFDSSVGNVTIYNATGSNGQTLYGRVQAVNGVGLAGSWTGNTDGIIIDVNAPSTPPTPIVVGVYGASTTVTFKWTAATDAISGVASYNLQVGTTAGGNDVFDANIGNVLIYNVTGTSGQTLYARVRAVDNAGLIGGWSGNSSGIGLPHAEPIPTLNEWGAILMVLSLIAVYFMRERKLRL